MPPRAKPNKLINEPTVDTFKGDGNPTFKVWEHQIKMACQAKCIKYDNDGDTDADLEQQNAIMAFMFTKCSADVQIHLMNLPEGEQTKAGYIAKLKELFEPRDQDMILKPLESIVTLEQGANESLREYRHRCLSLMYTCKQYNWDVMTTLDGKFMSHMITRGMRDRHQKATLQYQTFASFAQYDASLNNLAQSESIVNSGPAYDDAQANGANGYGRSPPYRQTNGKGGKKPYHPKPPGKTKWCTYHGTETHNTADCRSLKFPNNSSANDPRESKDNQQPKGKDNKSKPKKKIQANMANGHDDDDDDSDADVYMAIECVNTSGEGISLAANGTGQSIMDGANAVLDSAASPVVTSDTFLTKNNIIYHKTVDYDPPRKVRTANGLVNANFEAIVPMRLTDEEGKPHDINVATMVMRTDKVVPLLYGMSALRNSKSTFDFSSGVMHIGKLNCNVQWKLSNRTNIWYLPLKQPPNAKNRPALKQHVTLFNVAEPQASAALNDDAASDKGSVTKGNTVSTVPPPSKEIEDLNAYIVHGPAALVHTTAPPSEEDANQLYRDIDESNDDLPGLETDSDVEDWQQRKARPVQLSKQTSEGKDRTPEDEMKAFKASTVPKAPAKQAKKAELKSAKINTTAAPAAPDRDEIESVDLHSDSEESDNSAGQAANVIRFKVFDKATNQWSSEELNIHIMRGIIHSLHEELGHGGGEMLYAALKPHIKGAQIQRECVHVSNTCSRCMVDKLAIPAELRRGHISHAAQHPNDRVALDSEQYLAI